MNWKNTLFLAFGLMISGPAFSQCSELFFSEYLEGSSNNKALEIYNPTSSPINLSNYKVFRANNGSLTYQDSLQLAGTLAPGAVYIIGNPSATGVDPAIVAASDTLHTITFFNGDDHLMLKNITTNTQLDVIGTLGVDPGTNWVVGTGATSEFTLVRKVGIQQGNTDWTIGATEWDVYPQNTITFLGSHTMTSCAPLLNPTVSFSSAATVVAESNTTVTVTVNISPAGTTNSTSVTVSIGGASTATGGTDYTYTPVTLTWLAGDSTPQTVTVNIIDDAAPEGSETVELTLTNPTNNATVSGPNHVITITDNDFPTYNIGQINAVNALGVGDSIGLKCWIQGTVYGVNLRATGIQFTLRDNTGGIGVFNGAAFPGYTTVTETDTMKILGTINQFNGLLQIDPDSIVVIGTGAILKQPTVVTTLVEANESDLLQFNAGRLVNPAQWTGTGSGFNVDVTDGTNTITVRIDNDVNLYSQPAPTGIFTVCGLGSQFDNASPFDAGYQLMPRYTQDIKVLLDLDLGPDQQGCAGDSFTLDAGPAQAYLWSTGDTTQTITVPVGGTYWVEVTDTTYNVTDTDTIVLNQTPATVAAFNANQLTGFDFQFNNSSIGATAYSWDFGDGNTSTAASPTHTYGIPGSYAVTLIATGPCNSDTTDTLVVAFVGIDAGLDLGISLFPVPTEGEFSVLLEKGTHSSTILTITDLTGKVLVAERFNQWMAGESKSFRIDLPGVYFLNLQTDEGTQQRKLVVH